MEKKHVFCVTAHTKTVWQRLFWQLLWNISEKKVNKRLKNYTNMMYNYMNLTEMEE